MASSIMIKKTLLLKNIPNSRPEYKIHTLFMTKMAKILFIYKFDTVWPLSTASTCLVTKQCLIMFGRQF